MRYFKTSNASRQYRPGDLVVTFEPAENIGGSWSGLLAVEDDFTASKLAAAAIPQVTEITFEEYDAVKKKHPLPNSSYHNSPAPASSTPQLPVAVGVGRGAFTSSSKPPEQPAPVQVELKAAVVDVPDELKEIAPTPKPKRRAK